MNDIETEITGVAHESPIHEIVERIENNHNLKVLREAEIKNSWLHHEGTTQVISKLNDIRLDKLTEAEEAAMLLNNDRAVRLLVEARSIRTTIEIIKTGN